MTTLRLANYDVLWLLWVLPVLAVLYGYSLYRKRRALEAFAAHELLGRINAQFSLKRQIAKALLLLLAATAVIAALTEPGWNPRPEKIQRRGRDLVILLDVSRSMLAEDIYPNRLERAKLSVSELIDALQGDRVGVIAFAGTAVLKCPLTQDYAFARMALADITPQSVSRGGTQMGDAIRKATTEVFDQMERDYKDIILITDGEDHESFPVEAAEKAAQQGLRIFCIGLGNDQEGSRIPITDAAGNKTFAKYQGREIWSKLDSQTLSQIALKTRAKYWNVGIGTFNLDELYVRAILPADKKELESTTILQYDEKFQIFLALALGLLMFEAALSERKKI